MVEAEVGEVVGLRGRHDSGRAAVRHGHEDGQVTLGGRRVAVKRPSARAAAGENEVALKTYERFVDRDLLTRVVLELMCRPFGDIRLAALMLDGIGLKGCCCVVSLGVSTDRVKAPLGLWDGSTENKTVTVQLLAELVDRGLDVEQGVLVVFDGSKALRAAVNEVLGPVTVQRCIRHNERNVLDHLPERDRPTVKMRLRRAWASSLTPIPVLPRRCEKAWKKH